MYGANNIMMNSRIINPIFPSTTFRMVVSVINPTYHIENLLIFKATTTKHTKEPKNSGIGYSLGGQMIKPLDLTR